MQDTDKSVPETASPRSPALAGLLSLIIPGVGQLYLGERNRGLSFLGVAVILAGLLTWLHIPALYLGLLPFWLWNAWDARQRARGQRPSFVLGFVLVAVVVYAIGWQVTEISVGKLILGVPKIRPVVASLVQPDVMTRDVEVVEAVRAFESPCSDSPPPVAQPGASGPYLVAEPTCGDVGDVITIRGGNFAPSHTGELWWQNPIGQQSRLRAGGQFVDFQTDSQGQFSKQIAVPDVVPQSFQRGPQMHQIIARISQPVGNPHPSKTFWLVVERMGETIAQALMATTLGILLAVPVSFFGARNLMAVNPVGTTIYYATRTVLNILRSIEPLIMAIVFVVWVGLGPFAGVLALVAHSIAALGKLYSEAIESIDPGPIEAVTATGANRAQVVVYAVLPQVLPPFVAFSIYRWDINVRMSTILGFVGGGGIGFLLQQWIRLSAFREAATAIWAIAIVVTALDYASAQVRERIV
jgi:phosphonate transport system permease protein